MTGYILFSGKIEPVQVRRVSLLRETHVASFLLNLKQAARRHALQRNMHFLHRAGVKPTKERENKASTEHAAAWLKYEIAEE